MRRSKESGLALIMSLMILVIVSAAAVATMESTSMQLKMSSAGLDRKQAFEAAEAALRVVEENITNNVDNLASKESMRWNCSGSECFNAECDNGRCFQGVWLETDDETRCQVVDSNTEDEAEVSHPETSPWQTGSGSKYLNVWDNDSGRHMTVSLDGYTNPVRYLVEFRCFTPADPDTELSPGNDSQMFRITARGMSNNGRTEVMLQSSFKRTY